MECLDGGDFLGYGGYGFQAAGQRGGEVGHCGAFFVEDEGGEKGGDFGRGVGG